MTLDQLIQKLQYIRDHGTEGSFKVKAWDPDAQNYEELTHLVTDSESDCIILYTDGLD